jgi:hypothetical protein
MKSLQSVPSTARLPVLLLFLLSLQAASAFYDPGLQRWINRDPIGESGGINLYISESNDPMDRFDPFGEADAPKDQPPVTSPPGFGEKLFKPGTDNCLCYALDRPGGELQPDKGFGNKNAKNCTDLLSQIKKNYQGGDVPKGGTCPPALIKSRCFPMEIAAATMSSGRIRMVVGRK